MARRYSPARYAKSQIADNARTKGNDMERLIKKIDCIKLQERKQAGTIDGNGDGIYDRT